jgi:serine phosphatase RsbU (regulator of sigma subunit)
MFGKKRFRNVIRNQARNTARNIMQAVMTEVDAFCRPLNLEDDVTLVVVRVDS